MRYDVVVIGGGPAGATAAWHLASHGIRVALLDKDRFPRHVVCGEFMSPESARALAKLGVFEEVREAGARIVRSACITASDGQIASSDLEAPGLAVSRYALDQVLMENARRAGADVRQGTAAKDVTGDLNAGFAVQTDDGEIRAHVVIGAFGKRSVIDRALQRPFFERRTSYVGVKQHFAETTCGDAVELHGFDGGYCGLVSIEGGRMNACGLVRADVLKTVGPRDAIRGLQSLNPILATRLANVEPAMGRPIAISQVSFAFKDVMHRDICMIGDAAGLITPLCGDGVAMALDGGERAAGLVRAFLLSDLGTEEFRNQYRQRWKQQFARRMKVGRMLNRAFLLDGVTRYGIRALRRTPAITRWMIRATRG